MVVSQALRPCWLGKKCHLKHYGKIGTDTPWRQNSTPFTTKMVLHQNTPKMVPCDPTSSLISIYQVLWMNLQLQTLQFLYCRLRGLSIRMSLQHYHQKCCMVLYITSSITKMLRWISRSWDDRRGLLPKGGNNAKQCFIKANAVTRILSHDPVVTWYGHQTAPSRAGPL